MADDWTLKAHTSLPKGKPVLVCILDGYGENQVKDEWNAVHVAKTPHFDKLREVPTRFRSIAAHGPAVGLPSWDDMGNSEVGHNALGAGKIYAQGAKLVDINIESGQIFTDPGWKYISSAFGANTVHFIGLLSDGGVHSRANQLSAMVKRAAADGAKRIRCHVLTDGRDVPDGTSIAFIEALETELAELSSAGCDARIASGGGRMKVTMDRYEAEWEMVERGWKAHVLGEADVTGTVASELVTKLKADTGANDQNLDAFVIVDEAGAPVGKVGACRLRRSLAAHFAPPRPPPSLSGATRCSPAS